ncbi:hypothetical protein GTP91_19450 [Rugamonas sp. FT82W]|uniref:Metallo-beta-lactamase domain-containing protein n=1 Tax=Duganella vulcania TaxID=2692166 RepID=A0A845G934_9BURK|nr:MBL fold metallo-hydrolase [Duganella vulcania]MYM89339.1 hypothetical protein [Duganella vulcania]
MITEIYPTVYLLSDSAASGPSQFVYMLRHATGLVMFGTKSDLSAHYDDLRRLGTFTHILLGDRHHATQHTRQLARHLGLGLSATKAEAAALKGVEVEVVLPFQRTLIVPGLEAIPTPGHTAGALSFLWTHAGRRYLFVGDTIVPVDGGWQYWVIKPNLQTMRQSMRQLAALNADVILSNSFAATPQAWCELDAGSRDALFAGLDQRLAA